MITLVTYCSKKKRKDRNPLPAIRCYLSDRINTVWKKAKREERSMLILSGLLGLIRPDTPIMWYDKLLMPHEVGGMVDLVSHQLLWLHVEAVEYVTEDLWLEPSVKPYHDLLAAACKRQGVEMTMTNIKELERPRHR
jgi:hypothetical protein